MVLKISIVFLNIKKSEAELGSFPEIGFSFFNLFFIQSFTFHPSNLVWNFPYSHTSKISFADFSLNRKQDILPTHSHHQGRIINPIPIIIFLSGPRFRI